MHAFVIFPINLSPSNSHTGLGVGKSVMRPSEEGWHCIEEWGHWLLEKSEIKCFIFLRSVRRVGEREEERESMREKRKLDKIRASWYLLTRSVSGGIGWLGRLDIELACADNTGAITAVGRQQLYCSLWRPFTQSGYGEIRSTSAFLNLPQLSLALEEIKNISPTSWKGAEGSWMFVVEHTRVTLTGMKGSWSTLVYKVGCARIQSE